MKALLFVKPYKMDVIEKELRKLNDDELVIKVDTCGVCGTDFHIYKGESIAKSNTILGHEFCGTIVDNNNNSDFGLDDKVVIDPNIYCGKCYYCRNGKINFCVNHKALGVTEDGGFAEFCIAPSKQVYKIPNHISLSVISFTEPLSCCLRAINKSKIKPGDSVVILGYGAIGLLMLQLMRLQGVSKTILLEPVKYRQEIACKFGADFIFSPNDTDIKEKVWDITNGGADVVIECVGKPEAVSTCLDLVKCGGKIILFGVHPINSKIFINLHHFFLNELTICSSYLNPITFSSAIELLVNNKINVDQIPTERVNLEMLQTILEYGPDEKILKYQFHN